MPSKWNGPLFRSQWVAQQIAVVCGEDDDRIVGQAKFVELIQDSSHLLVDERGHAVGNGSNLAHLLVRHLGGEPATGGPLVGLIHQAHVRRQIVELIVAPRRRGDRVLGHTWRTRDPARHMGDADQETRPTT